jgi:hypothetical protein
MPAEAKKHANKTPKIAAQHHTYILSRNYMPAKERNSTCKAKKCFIDIAHRSSKRHACNLT